MLATSVAAAAAAAEITYLRRWTGDPRCLMLRSHNSQVKKYRHLPKLSENFTFRFAELSTYSMNPNALFVSITASLQKLIEAQHR